MAITGIDTIEGKQIIAAGAVSAKSAEMAYNDENGNPITGYQLAGDYYSASNPSGFITGVDLTPYQTVEGMTAYQPAGDYLTTADSAEFYTTANESGFITNDAITGKQDITGMTAYQPVGEYYSASNPSGFITGVDLSDYATTAELADKQDITGMTAYQPVGNYQTAGDYLTTADSGNFYPMTGNPSGFINELPDEEEVEFEEIDLADYQPVSSMTAYANSADVTGTAQYGLTTAGWSEITGGGTVPTGVMVESGLEYNAVNEISGYNGSAIAQYGAEKQWLVHDDTLVHASNSAQYALGVNLSAVAQLLGVDETVLYSGIKSDVGSDGYATYTLSESPINFNKIKIYWCMRNNTNFENGNKGIGFVEYDPSIYSADQTYVAAYMNGSDVSGTLFPYRSDSNIVNIRTTTWFTKSRLIRLDDNTELANNAAWFHIYKVVGIGRKEV